MFIIVGQQDFKEATEYMDGYNCPLAMALKRYFPDGDPGVGDTNFFLTVNGDRRHFETNGWGQLHSSKITTYIIAAKKGQEVPSFEVEIIGL